MFYLHFTLAPIKLRCYNRASGSEESEFIYIVRKSPLGAPRNQYSPLEIPARDLSGTDPGGPVRFFKPLRLEAFAAFLFSLSEK